MKLFLYLNILKIGIIEGIEMALSMVVDVTRVAANFSFVRYRIA